MEKNNCHIVIVDLHFTQKLRLINIYRSFHPPDGSSATDFFMSQLEIIRSAICSNCYIMGDFNLDGGMNLRPDYHNKMLQNKLKLLASELKLIQVVEFNTWLRIINGTRKESLLDHVYLNNLASLNSIYFEIPIFGDHVLVIAELSIRKLNTENNSLVRNWSTYSDVTLKTTLNPLIMSHCLLFINCSVQTYWNLLESVLIAASDTVSPLQITDRKKPKNFIPPI